MDIIKYTVYIPDFEGYGEEEYKTVIKQNEFLSIPSVFINGKVSIDDGTWDDHELNGADEVTFKKYFK